MTLLSTYYGYTNAAKLIKLHTSVVVSENFLQCYDEQLSRAFEIQTGITIAQKTWLCFDEDLSFIESGGNINGMRVKLLLGYGIEEVSVKWKSKSGNPVDMAAQNVECSDLIFEFENLNAEFCRHCWKPVWSLFTIDTSKDFYQRNFKAQGFEASYSFLKCADVQLSKSFVEATGLKINKNICFMVPSAEDLKYRPGQPSFYENGAHQSLLLKLTIHAYGFYVKVLWYSKSGKIYTGAEQEIDGDDIVFYFEQLDPEAYHKELYPDKVYFPVPVKKLPFKVQVHSLQRDCTIAIKLLQEDELQIHELSNALPQFIADFNSRQHLPDDEGKVEARGVIVNDPATIHLECDMRVAGFDFFKELFKFLSAYKCIAAVEID